MPTIWHQAEVISIRPLTASVTEFTIQILGIDSFEFKAGQFLTFDLPVGTKRQDRWKSYSIASRPTGSAILELCIAHMEGGLASNYFFNEVRIGTILRCKGPEGGFVIPPDVETKHLILICTGTGLAPFRSMIHDLFAQNRMPASLHLIFGARTIHDILYLDEWVRLETTSPRFKFDISLSREKELPPDAHYHAGYVHPIYRSTYSEYNEANYFMICGWSRMIDEAVENLFLQMKYPRNQIIYELYG
jgi:ferredoxin-NADP reductase